jgi:signal transduction histidine kinase
VTPGLAIQLGAGLALGGALAWSAYLARTAKRRARDSEETSRRLTEANARLEALLAEREHTQAALQASEEQLRQSQKMEAVGRLAGGIAHDFNNILTAITSYAEFLLEAIPPEDPRSDDAREIRRAARRAATLTSQLLAFSRRQVRQPRVLDLNAVLTELEKILRRLIGEDVRLVLDLAPDPGSVKADQGQLEQVIVNLVVNASDAMPEGGTITLRTERMAVHATGVAAVRGLSAGDYLVLHVSDTGHGMDDATRARIFEPFFTTKAPGKGTGLGLATVYAIAEQSGGTVQVRSAPRQGATFSVYLPAIDETAEVFSSGVFAPTAPRGTEVVLIAEDDDAVRTLAARILERHGYTVLQARHGREALDQARHHPGQIDLLITDVVMPELGGRRLAESLAAQRPELRVLYMSGYTAGEIDRRGELDGGVALLQKPFAAQPLLLKVREVLDAPRA